MGALAFDAVREPVPAPAERRVRPTIAEDAVYCPPSGGDDSARVAITGTERAAVPVRSEPRTEDAGEAGLDATVTSRRLVMAVPSSPAPTIAAFGGSIAAHSVASPASRGAVASACSHVASTRWYFAAGSSALGIDDRLVISNPFLDEAVVRVVFYTPTGPRAKTALADVAIPAGDAVEVSVDDYILRQPVLGALVEVNRGRVVAWKREYRRAAPAGASLALGAPATATGWFFPDGVLGESYDERLAVLNPSARQAIVTVTLAGSRRVVQPPDLVEVSLPPGTVREFDLGALVPTPRDALGLGAVIRSQNGVGIVAERSVRYTTSREEGVTAEIGAPRAARRWQVGPAARVPVRDALVVLNTGRRDAHLHAVLVRPGGDPIAPRALRSISVPAGLIVRLPVSRWTHGKPMGAVVTSDAPVVVERSAYSRAGSDVAASMGLPVP